MSENTYSEKKVNVHRMELARLKMDVYKAQAEDERRRQEHVFSALSVPVAAMAFTAIVIVNALNGLKFTGVTFQVKFLNIGAGACLLVAVIFLVIAMFRIVKIAGSLGGQHGDLAIISHEDIKDYERLALQARRKESSTQEEILVSTELYNLLAYDYGEQVKKLIPENLQNRFRLSSATGNVVMGVFSVLVALVLLGFGKWFS